MSKHTPGPWMLSLSGPTVYALHGETLRNRFSATAQGGRSDDAGPDELRANAVLMRASPDLLQALQLVAAHIPEIIAAGILTAAETDTIRAAITKAGD